MQELISFVMSGEIRVNILQILAKSNKTPSLLAKEMKTHQSTTSRALAILQKKGLVICLTPKSKLSRIYSITNKGKKIINEINKITG
ncbi:winged helix-turn-helix transcriptional regulator [Candidatus Woesearchaeota archaeon]|nr:winged helix-turn-helix transcriptional regulator [Candidatus Woesearchaeota archaeon]